MNVAEVILSRGEDSATAVLYKEAVLTYAELRQKVARLAGGLLVRGHWKGDRIGILSENNPFFVKAYLGILRAGMVAVPFQTELAADTFRKIVSDADIKEMFVSNRFLKYVRPWAEELGLALLPESSEEHLGGDPTLPLPELND